MLIQLINGNWIYPGDIRAVRMFTPNEDELTGRYPSRVSVEVTRGHLTTFEIINFEDDESAESYRDSIAKMCGGVSLNTVPITLTGE